MDRAAGHEREPSGVLAADTSRGVERLQVGLWRAMSSHDKARTVAALARMAQELSLAGIRRRHPEASEGECALRLAVIKLGHDLALRVYPEAAALLDH